MKTPRILISLALLLSIVTTADASDQFWNRKKRRKAEIAAEQQRVQDSISRAEQARIEAEQAKLIVDTVSKTIVTSNSQITLNYTGAQMDSLLTVWRERQANDQFESFFNNYINADSVIENSTVPDSIYAKRLQNLISPIHLPYNDITKNYVARYLNTKYGTINRIMSLSQYYFPFIEEELIKSGLPVELRAMPIIESALSATAISRAGAAGLWQFMPTTGKSYGLEVNTLVDERCDPLLATKAACRFLQDLYALYDDWTLAIAAYNCGPGNVNKALARAGLKEGTFWDIYYYLPRETRGYVPAFIGATYAYTYHKLHGIEFDESPLPLATDTIHVTKVMHLGQVSEVLEIPMETLRALNPQYRKDIIPAATKEYALRLPQRYVVNYIENEQAIMAKDSVYLKEYLNPEKVKKAMSASSGLIHRVRSGETLGSIANKYRVSTQSIIRWNNLRNPDRLSIGQRLRIEGR